MRRREYRCSGARHAELRSAVGWDDSVLAVAESARAERRFLCGACGDLAIRDTAPALSDVERVQQHLAELKLRLAAAEELLVRAVALGVKSDEPLPDVVLGG